MLDLEEFRVWLSNNTSYSDAVIGDIVCRMRRANSILEWDGQETYLYYLGENDGFKALSMSVRSQLRKAVKLYKSFCESKA